MPQEALHDGDLDAVFQAVSGEAVPQTMNAAAIGQSGFGYGAML